MIEIVKCSGECFSKVLLFFFTTKNKTMSKITVLKTEGKGRERADFVTVMLFDKKEDAENFITFPMS